MKKSFWNIVFLVFILVFSTTIVGAGDTFYGNVYDEIKDSFEQDGLNNSQGLVGNTLQFMGTTKLEKDTYIVKYGTTIIYNGGGTLESMDSTKANISGKKINIVGTGSFIIKANGNELKFFSWNAHLTQGKYWVYNDVNKKIKNNILYAEAFLDVEKTSNSQVFKVKDVCYGKNGSFYGELRNKYITNYYKGEKSYYQYAFDTNFDSKLTANDVKFNVDSPLELEVGQLKRLEVLLTKDNSKLTDGLTWKIGDEKIATLLEGNVKAKSVGTTKVTCKVGDSLTLECEVIVKEATPVIDLNNIEFSDITEKIGDKYAVKVGTNVKLNTEFDSDEVEVTYSDATNGVNKKAEIIQDENGLGLKILKAGEFTITIKYNGETVNYNFFAWNMYLKQGQFYAYKSPGKKDRSLQAKTYLAVSEYKEKYVKIDEHLFGKGGNFSGQNLNGKYLTNHYITGEYKGYYEYAFDNDVIEDDNGSIPEQEPSGELPQEPEEPPQEPEEEKKIELNETSLKLCVNDIYELKLLINGVEAKDGVTWKSNAEQIATVSNGEVLAKEVGKTQIVCTIDGMDLVCEVEVVKREYSDETENGFSDIIDDVITKVKEYFSVYKEIIINNSKLNKDTLKLYVGKTETLKATISKLSNVTVTWESEDESIASVTDGVVTAKKAGTTKVFCNVGNLFKLECTVEVMPIPEEETLVNLTDNLEVHFINPKDGDYDTRVDAIYVKFGDKSLFIDGGHHYNAAAIIKYLDNLGVEKIDYYIGSHSDSNHVGAAGPLVRKYNIEAIFYNADDSTLSTIKSKIKEYAHDDEKAELKAIEDCEKIAVKAGDEVLNENGLKIICVGPVKKASDSNPKSLILRFEYGEHSFLFTGDTKDEQLEAAYKKYPELLSVDIFKNPHHNQNVDKNIILNLIKPKYYIFATGKSNLPSQSTTKMLIDNNIKYFIASENKDRNVLIESDGENLRITTKYNLKNIEPEVVINEF